ncbi:hypothetical protein ACFOGJ_24270 [Marinibaculum pumilum]|uniref:Uncharacterized protein n=1 Tax=Marinibaculum pumilum TaxID=1766165 RepID=A0ABV7L809_9PROT
MIEKVGHVSNPLTVIAIFAAISEISLVGGMTVVAPELQRTYIWFVMIFPTILVVAFFGVLVWNRRVLYAPSDFRDDTAFIDLIQGQSREFVSQVDEAIQLLKSTTTELNGTIAESEGNAEHIRAKDLIKINDKFLQIQESLASTAESADKLYESASAELVQSAIPTPKWQFVTRRLIPFPNFQKLLDYLKSRYGPTIDESTVEVLISRGLITRSRHNEKIYIESSFFRIERELDKINRKKNVCLSTKAD